VSFVMTAVMRRGCGGLTSRRRAVVPPRAGGAERRPRRRYGPTRGSVHNRFGVRA
jgi:hypothetical protein